LFKRNPDGILVIDHIPTNDELFEKVAYTEENFDDMIEKLGRNIAEYLLAQGKRELTEIVVLNGAQIFYDSLSLSIKDWFHILSDGSRLKTRRDSIRLSSYGDSTNQKHIEIVKDLDIDATDQTVIVYEDIADTCKTLNFFMRLLRKRGAKEILLTVMIKRITDFIIENNIIWTGFEYSGQEWLCGKGLDYLGMHRELNSIMAIKKQFCQDEVTKQIAQLLKSKSIA